MVDYNKLKRNYRDNPLKRGERPEIDDLRLLYIDLGISLAGVGKVIGRAYRVAQAYVKEAGLTKTKEQVRQGTEQTNLQVYGVRAPAQNAEVIKKFHKTCQKRYGVSAPIKNKAIRGKVEATNLSKYGAKYPMQNKSLQNKANNTLQETHGVTSPFKKKEFLNKAKITWQRTMGVDNPAKDDTVKNKLSASAKITSRDPEVIAKTRAAFGGARTYAQSLLPKESVEILEDIVIFTNFIQTQPIKTIKSLARVLGASSSTVQKRVNSYKLTHLVDTYQSDAELVIASYFPSIKFRKDRKILDGLEIDLYSEEHKIGIEFNGNYWHSELGDKDKKYHRNKTDLAAEKGIFIYHIFEYEWTNTNRRKAIVSQLNNLFGLNKETIFARKCEIKTVPGNIASGFFDNNHSIGAALAGIKLGLYHNNELVSVMSFAPNAINKNYQYELNRFCSKAGTNVVGGASKLFKHFIKTYAPKSIISYSDIAKTKGSLYKTLEFKENKESAPQYHWTNGTNTLSRHKTQLKRLIKLGWKTAEDGKTEVQIMKEQGYGRIWDCGKKVWVWEPRQ